MPLSENLPKAKVKSFILILLVEEISKQASIDSAVWILVVTLMKAYDGKEQGKIFEEKKSTRKCNGAKSLNGLRNGIKRLVPSGQDPTQLGFQLMKRN